MGKAVLAENPDVERLIVVSTVVVRKDKVEETINKEVLENIIPEVAKKDKIRRMAGGLGQDETLTPIQI